MALTCRVKLCVCLVVVVLSPSLSGEEVAEQSSRICDDGKYMIEEDMGGSESWECQEQPFRMTAFLEPSTHEECSTVTEESLTKCMDTPIEYSAHPPSSGSYRPLRPKYGDYHYLPPQRWLNALKYGAVAFLYHPCAPRDQVLQLKQLAKSCLWRHIISPYPHLTQELLSSGTGLLGLCSESELGGASYSDGLDHRTCSTHTGGIPGLHRWSL